MVRISRTGSTIRQTAYAMRKFGGKGLSKKQIALDVGYPPSVANAVSSKIENRRGYHNAVAKLASESGNLALKIMEELKGRNFSEFSNKELISGISAIGGAWSKFNTAGQELDAPTDSGKNRLRTIILERANVIDAEVTPPVPEKTNQEKLKEEINSLDF